MICVSFGARLVFAIALVSLPLAACLSVVFPTVFRYVAEHSTHVLVTQAQCFRFATKSIEARLNSRPTAAMPHYTRGMIACAHIPNPRALTKTSSLLYANSTFHILHQTHEPANQPIARKCKIALKPAPTLAFPANGHLRETFPDAQTQKQPPILPKHASTLRFAFARNAIRIAQFAQFARPAYSPAAARLRVGHHFS